MPKAKKSKAAKSGSKATKPNKAKTAAVEVAPPTAEFEPDTLLFDQPASKWPPRLALLAGLVFVLLVGFELLHTGRAYPAVYANGASLGGKNRAEAIATLRQVTDEYKRELIPVRFENTIVRVSPQKLGFQPDLTAAADQALAFGRQGTIITRLKQQVRALLGRRTDLAAYSYQFGKLTPYLQQIDDDLRQPARDAKLNFADHQVNTEASQAGRRLDFGRLTLMIQDRLSRGDLETIDAPVSTVQPAIDTVSLAATRDQAAAYVGQPITVKYGDQTSTITSEQITRWLKVTRPLSRPFDQTGQLTDFYPMTRPVDLGLDEPAVKNYVAELAKKVDQPGQDAALTIQDGRVTVFRPSRTGTTLDQAGAAQAILASLEQSGSSREVTLVIKVTKPTVTEENLNNLGINELISEGVSFFPGSIPERMQNIRTGSARFNGVLLKPDETFSFGALLGDVGPETGYAPARVIIGNRQETQYGGGLCQVSSTAYRAALNAGLPITQRTNHSFAVSYYTQPYGVPGVDATIYYPQVDLKFKNDTGAHILIQTILQGTTLKFQFYGTKTKEGRIRGPEFVSGSADATKPSKTVFYRDVIKDGQVIKTDTIYTSYKSSLDFPVQPQFN